MSTWSTLDNAQREACIVTESRVSKVLIVVSQLLWYLLRLGSAVNGPNPHPQTPRIYSNHSRKSSYPQWV